MQNYYNRFNTTKNYDKTIFLSGRGLQSAELNEIQDYANHKIKTIGDAVFNDGDVVEGAACVINQENGDVTIESGRIYLRGFVREIGNATFTIPTSGHVRIGIYYQEQTITELEDPELRDPAIGTRNYQEPGAARLKYTLSWGFAADGIENKNEGEFYPVYAVTNGVLIIQSPPPQLDAVTTGLARYDREANGSYVVKGFEVIYLETDGSEQVFVVSEGKAHVEGFEIELPHSLRLRFAEDADIAVIESEPHNFQPDDKGDMRINVNNAPLHAIDNIDITATKTITIVHGSYTGAIDPLPDESVLEIVSAKQGSKEFTRNDDYKLTSGDIDWSPSGSEPAPGSSYDITYKYRKTVDASDIDNEGFTISGAVPGSLVLIDYKWKMPRVDLITLCRQGMVRRIKGISHPYNPSMPGTPAGHLALAYITQNWQEKVTVTNHAIHTITMSEIEAMQNSIYNLYDLMAQERLRNDANAAEPAAKRGIFVDPFLDDDMRDQGVEQNAAIVDGELTLPINATVTDTAKIDKALMLNYELEPVIEQTLRTGSMKVNPYQAFAPVPAKVKINLDVDRWTEVKTNWSSPVTRRFSRFTSPLVRRVNSSRNSRITRNVLLSARRSESNEVLSSNEREAEFMRQATQEFTVEGFESGEKLQMVFDGINIEPEKDSL